MDRIGIGIGMDPVMGPGLGSGWNGVNWDFDEDWFGFGCG